METDKIVPAYLKFLSVAWLVAASFQAPVGAANFLQVAYAILYALVND